MENKEKEYIDKIFVCIEGDDNVSESRIIDNIMMKAVNIINNKIFFESEALTEGDFYIKYHQDNKM